MVNIKNVKVTPPTIPMGENFTVEADFENTGEAVTYNYLVAFPPNWSPSRYPDGFWFEVSVSIPARATKHIAHTYAIKPEAAGSFRICVEAR